MSNKQWSLRQYINLEVDSYRFDKMMMKKCRPSAPKLYRAPNGTMLSIDLWIDWNGRLFCIRKINDNNTIVTYLIE